MPLNFNPPLLNSANPWATTKEHLQALYDCPYTGAITTRTSIDGGFSHNDTIHQYCFFNTKDHKVTHHSLKPPTQDVNPALDGSTSSLNTLGYSPISLQLYVDIISSIIRSSQNRQKPVIFSVTGTPKEISWCYDFLHAAQKRLRKDTSPAVRFLMEINLSCPNIANKPPPAYSKPALLEYLHALSSHHIPTPPDPLPVGLKTPPYTYQTQFDQLISALLDSPQSPECSIIAFITATNTLGNCLVLDADSPSPALDSASGTGIGGLAGSALHPLALGNVATLRRMLDAHTELRGIEIIGVGGVSDSAAFKRMRSVGAAAVAVGTALGAEGVGVFGKIWEGVRVMEAG